MGGGGTGVYIAQKRRVLVWLKGGLGVLGDQGVLDEPCLGAQEGFGVKVCRLQ